MDRETRIYVLVDPFDNEIRYVGKTVASLKKRLCGHLTQARNRKFDTYRDRWIRGLLVRGAKPAIKGIEVCGSNWADRERFWISHYRETGARLTNHTDGGEGSLGIEFSAERRRRCSERVKLELENPSVRAARIKQLLKNSSDPEFRQRRSEQHTEWMMNPDRRARYAECMTTQMSDPARRAKSSAHMKAVMTDPERRAARDAKAAAYWTPEKRAEQALRAKAQAIKRRAEQSPKAINCD